MCDIALIPLLLQQTENLLELRSEWRKNIGENFNIFTLLGLEYDEVNLHCRLLYELLSPDGAHDMGDSFLREFFTLVLGKAFPEDSPVRVYREYPFAAEDTGRIDLLIDGQDFCYPIEVKIDAPDQKLQVRRYAKFAASCANDSQVYYLTLTGNSPTEYSTGGDDMPSVVCLSFAGEIRSWLTRCREIAALVPAISEIIRQYIGVLDMLTGYNKGDIFMDKIEGLIGASRGSYESAVAIADALPTVYTEMMRRVFREIKEYIGDRMKLLYSDYEEKAEIYNMSKRYSFPCLVYSVRKQNDLTLCFVIEVYWVLYAGLALYDDQFKRVPDTTQELPEHCQNEAWQDLFSSLHILDDKKDAWVQHLSYDNPLDFWHCDGIYPDLFDSKRHEEIMKEIFAELDDWIATLQELDYDE